MKSCTCFSSYLCGPCTRILTDDLRIISGHFGSHPFRTLFEELDITMSRTDRIASMHVGPTTNGSDEQPLMYNVKVSDAKSGLKQAMMFAREHIYRENQHMRWDVPIDGVAERMLLIPTLIRSNSEVKQIASRIRHAVAKAQVAIDRPSDRFYLGCCNGTIAGEVCGAELYASEKTPEELTCRVCGSIHPVRERRFWLLNTLQSEIVTAAMVDGWIFPNGTELRKATIRKWKQRGLILPQGKRGKEWLYRMGDITTLVLRGTGVT